MTAQGYSGEGFMSRPIVKEGAVSLESSEGGGVEAPEALVCLEKKKIDVPDFEEKGLLNVPRKNSGF